MKSLLFAALLLSTGAKATPLLTDIEQEDLLQSIDNICGDTWCEGDSNWSFDAMTCDSETGCVLDLTMKPYDFDEDQTLNERPFQCSLPTFTSKESLIEDSLRGIQYTPELYDAVSACINNISDNYGPIYVPIDNKCSSLFSPDTVDFVYTTKVKVNTTGVYAAIEAVSQLVSKQAKKDPTCELTREPYYRDSASCEINKDLSEVCTLPSLNGSYIVTRSVKGVATVVYQTQTKVQAPYKNKPAVDGQLAVKQSFHSSKF